LSDKTEVTGDVQVRSPDHRTRALELAFKLVTESYQHPIWDPSKIEEVKSEFKDVAALIYEIYLILLRGRE